MAAYVLAGATVLIAGINRGAVLPVLRPSEALTLLLGLALVVRAVIRSSSAATPRIRVTRIDVALVLFAVTGSAVPLAWMVFRGEPVATDDRWLRANAGAVALAAAVDLGLRLQRFAWSSWAARSVADLCVERAERLDPDLDVQFRAPADATVAPHRSAAWINWLLEHRFGDDPSIRKAAS